ncbi:MAG TPA: MFS transporter [Thermoplasmata archaeon]|nr:MFS transporter [Thermoplasmata archaeon]
MSSDGAPSARDANRSTWILIAVRAGYAYNWFTIGPALPAIGAAFSVGPGEWGVLVASFLVGAGAMQVPAGLWARRYGPRSVGLSGAVLLGVGSILCALAPSFLILWVLRIVAGIGAGLFFSPAIGLVSSLHAEGRRGLAVGGFSSAFSAGAALGLFVSAIVVADIGWQWDLALGGIGLLVLTGIAAFIIPRSAGAAPPRTVRMERSPRAFRTPAVWAIGFAFIGLEGAAFVTSQFVVPYGTLTQGWTAAAAGAVGIAFVLPSVVGGPYGGTVAERRPDHRTQFVLATLAGAAVLFVLPWSGLVGAVVIGIAFSFSYGFIYAVMYIVPQYMPDLPREEIPLAIGLFNSIQLAGSAVIASAFGWVLAATSYSFAWPALAVMMLVPLAVLLAIPPLRRSSRRSAVSGGAGPAVGAVPGRPLERAP